MGPFDHAWSLLKAAGRTSPVGGSKESQPTGRYNPSIHPGDYQYTNIAPGRSSTSKINPREMVEEAEPPTSFQPSDYQQEDPGMDYGHSFIDADSTRLQEEMMRDFESRAGGPPVSSGYNKPIEDMVEHARGYVPEGEYAGAAPKASGAIRYESDSSVGQGWRDFDKKRNPLEPQLDPQTWTSPSRGPSQFQPDGPWPIQLDSQGNRL